MKLNCTLKLINTLLLSWLSVIPITFANAKSVKSENLYSFKNADYFIEGGLRYGSVIYHPQSAVYLKDLYFGSIEARFGMQTRGLQQWEKSLNYPIIGIALRYTDYTDFSDPENIRTATNKILGKNIAVFGYLQGNIIKAKWFKWHYQLGMGITTFTSIYGKGKVWHPEGKEPSDFIVDGEPMDEFPENKLISLYVNPYINFQMGFDFELTPQIDLCLNANFLHISNANMNMPNFGMNEIQGIAGVRYHFNKNITKHKSDIIQKFTAKNNLFFAVSPGWLWSRYDDCYYFKTGFSVGYMRNVISILNAGIEFEYRLANFLAPSREAVLVSQWNKAPAISRVAEDNSSESGLLDGGGSSTFPRKEAARNVYSNMPKTLYTSSLYGFLELAFGRFAFHIGVGGYMYKGPHDGIADKYDLAQEHPDENGDVKGTLRKNPSVYEKIGFRIYMGKTNRHFAGASVSAHFPVADYLAFTYGYKFYQFNDVKRRKNR
ncbi:MAG: acyloxyacyl hydrolase [Bacteroidales bacterium]|jgi:hypothetical protein|nr:acyloxyacyl hydrolase [Bacteroidales bacterium]